MKANNPMQLKAYVKNKAKKLGLPPHFAMQTYMRERLLERISLSEYRRQFVLKGGVLVSAMIGLDIRATMDIDATLINTPLTTETIKGIFNKILVVEIDDNIIFTLKTIKDIRKSDEYSGFRVSLSGEYPPIAQPLTIDITAGDSITPREIEFMYPLTFEERNISILAYNIETLLAEKLETIFSRGISSTRPRDYYDVYILWKLERNKADIATLCKALTTTCKKRKSADAINDWRKILVEIMANANLKEYWEQYRREFTYAKEIEFVATCDVLKDIMELVEEMNVKSDK